MPFRLDKLTLKAQEALQNAQSLASEQGNPEMDPLHLLAAVLKDGEGIAKPVLEKIGANAQQLSRLTDAEVSRLPKSSGGSTPQPGRPLMQVLEDADKQAAAMKDEF